MQLSSNHFDVFMSWWGRGASIEVPDAYLPPTETKPTGLAGNRLVLRLIRERRPDRIEMLEFEATNQYAGLVDAFAESIAAGRPVSPAEDGLAQMIALEQILTAAHQNR